MEELHSPEEELIRTRTEKLQKMRSEGNDPFAIERYERYAKLEKINGITEEIEPLSKSVITAYTDNEPA